MLEGFNNQADFVAELFNPMIMWVDKGANGRYYIASSQFVNDDYYLDWVKEKLIEISYTYENCHLSQNDINKLLYENKHFVFLWLKYYADNLLLNESESVKKDFYTVLQKCNDVILSINLILHRPIDFIGRRCPSWSIPIDYKSLVDGINNYDEDWVS